MHAAEGTLRVPFLFLRTERSPSGEFVRETRALMLQRTRIGIVLGAVILLAFIPVDAFRVAPGRYSEAVAARVLGAALLVPLLAATFASRAERWAVWIGEAALLELITVTAAMMRLFGGVEDPEYAIQGTGIVFCVLGGALLLPFDGRQMLVAGITALALHGAFTYDFPLASNFPILFATLTGVAIATVGAVELTRSRLVEFEVRRAKEDLLRARADFVAMLTHDLKNPLAAIEGYVQMIREEEAMPVAERAELLARVHGSARDAMTLAQNFLDVSKIEAGHVVLRKRRVDVGEVLRHSISHQRPLAELKAVSLAADVGIDLQSVDADPAVLDRVFANLVNNAIKHTPAGGSVRVSAHALGGKEIEIVVEDTGAGFPPGQESTIFDRYTSAATRADSTGLGLYIARTITLAHGGTIRAENRADGPGARFRVRLPTSKEPDQPRGSSM